jgi:hypothetical protein
VNTLKNKEFKGINFMACELQINKTIIKILLSKHSKIMSFLQSPIQLQIVLEYILIYYNDKQRIDKVRIDMFCREGTI